MAAAFEPMADAHGIILAGPEARGQPAGDWDQHSGGEKYWETRPDADPSRGCDPNRNPDLLLVRAIIQEAKRAYNVDPKRIYLAGFSNGGFFSVATAVALRDQIAAFVEMSAGLVTCDNTNSCSFQGSSTDCADLRREAGYCACTQSEKPITLPTAGRMPPAYITHGNQDYTVSVCYSCELAARMETLGHTAVVTIRGGEDHVVPDLSAPALYGPVWTFFEGHPLP
jgi:predicted esterase